jgi:signal transduction histidine kinase
MRSRTASRQLPSSRGNHDVPAPHPLARRIHDRVMQLVGTAMLKAEMAEQLSLLGRTDEVPATLVELRSALDDTVVELRSIMADLKNQAA